MNKAEAFLKEYRSKNRLSIIYNKASLGGEIAQIMEAYHQSRVNAIEDKKITLQTNSILTDAKNEGFVNGWNTCKEQLLKE